MAAFVVGHIARTNPPLARPGALVRALVQAPQIGTSAADVCEAARMLAHRFGYDSDHLEDLECVYESWDGTGFPGRASGAAITLPARVVYAATLAVSARTRRWVRAAAAALVAEASGHRLDPDVSKVFLDDPDGAFDRLSIGKPRSGMRRSPPSLSPPTHGRRRRPSTNRCGRWRTSSTSSHRGCAATRPAWPRSRSAAADAAGLPADQVRAVRRAGWLHDVGRIGVSSGVWARDRRLTPHEWEQVRLASRTTPSVC